MSNRQRVLIAGGGVAGLEAMLALHELAPEYVEVELIAPEPRYWYRAAAVAEPFGLGQVRSFELAELAQEVGAQFTLGEVIAINADARLAHTVTDTFAYDALLLACGAVPHPVLPGAITFRGPADTQLITELLRELDAGTVSSVAVAVPLGAYWSLPAYELALLIANHAETVGRDVDVALVTPEDQPLMLFGAAARDAVEAMLAARGIALYAGVCPTEVRDGELRLTPQATIPADRVIALPRLYGPPIDGLPQTRAGFVAVDPHGRVQGLSDVFAAGDLTNFPVKQGGIAAQQADAAAEAIAARAGADVEPRPFRPVLRGLLLTGGRPRFLRRDVGTGAKGMVSIDPLWWPPAKIVGRRLAPFLARIAGVPNMEPPEAANTVEVEVPVDVARLASGRHSTGDALDDDEGDERTAHDLMSTDLLIVAPEDTLGEIAQKLRARNVGSALVAEYGRLVGILTSRDLLRAFAGRIHSSEARAREWMTAEPITVSPAASASSALRLMNEHRIHHLPVVEHGRAVGLVGMRQVAQAVAERSQARPHVGLGF
jgi:sulfide:quinone oxidoreductase